MKSEKEKQLEIQLLTEKLQRISGKKIILKEDMFPDPPTPKIYTQKEIRDRVEEIIDTKSDWSTEELAIDVKGGEGELVLVNLRPIPAHLKGNFSYPDDMVSEEEWTDLAEALKYGLPRFYEYEVYKNGIVLKNNSKY